MFLPLTVLFVSLVVASSATAATGSVWTWGANYHGQLGNGSTTDAGKPVSVLAQATKVAGGLDHSLAVRQGRVWAWGDNRYGELGNGTSTGPSTCGGTPCSMTPVPSKATGVVAAAAGAEFSLALLGDGTVMAWGANNVGQLGIGTSFGPSTCNGVACSKLPVTVPGLTQVKAIAAGGNHALALLKDGTVMAWGSDSDGQLGVGRSGDFSPTPVRATGPNPYVSAIAAGYLFSLELTTFSQSKVEAWGDNSQGQLGQGTTSGPSTCGFDSCSTRPVGVKDLSGDEVGIAANGAAGHALALEGNGTVAAWGSNSDGATGSACAAEGSYCTTPQTVPGVSNATALAASGGFLIQQRSMALDTSGQVVEWGASPLGDGSSGSSDTPVKVSGMSAATAIAAGGLHSLAVAFPPSNRFHTVGRSRPCPRPCRVLGLLVRFPGPGIVQVKQALGRGAAAARVRAAKKRLIKPATVRVTHAGTVKIKLKLTRRARRAIKRKHKLRIKLRITFTPMGGTPRTKTVTITVILKKHR